jgi:outer membrane biogenesis lipoprotein LolB
MMLQGRRGLATIAAALALLVACSGSTTRHAEPSQTDASRSPEATAVLGYFRGAVRAAED